MKNLFFLIFLFLGINVFTNCVRLQDRNWKKYNIISGVKDFSHKITKEQKLKILPFELPSYSPDSNVVVRHIEKKHIPQISKNKKHTFWIMYYPCGSIINELADFMYFSKKMEKKYGDNFQTLWISLSYNLYFIQEIYTILKSNKTAYIASSNDFGDKLLKKHINFNKEIHKSLYPKYKDDLSDFYIFLVDNEENLIFEGEFFWNEKNKASELKHKKILLDFFEQNYPLK